MPILSQLALDIQNEDCSRRLGGLWTRGDLGELFRRSLVLIVTTQRLL